MEVWNGGEEKFNATYMPPINLDDVLWWEHLPAMLHLDQSTPMGPLRCHTGDEGYV